MFFDDNKAHLRTKINRGQGLTDSEKYLQRLCEKSFLSLWSYPRIFRDQDKAGKEICDLLVIFDHHIIIFSDKYCEFPVSDNIQLDWQRWYKRAIVKSAEQVWGAERWIKTYPDRIFLDQACTQKFPLQIPSPELAHYHLIVVAHGCQERCQQYFQGGSGSLFLISDSLTDATSMPFVIGDIDKTKTFVHVLNDSSLDIVLDTLDTIPDFVNYLEKKEKRFRAPQLITAAGEEDLLAFYLQQTNSMGEPSFSILEEENVNLGIVEGHWEAFCNLPIRINQIRQNQVSYIWDRLIERYSEHILNATQYYTNQIELSETELALRFMAKEPRFKRRLFSVQLKELVTNTLDGTRRIHAIIPNLFTDTYYIFLVLANDLYDSEEEYRKERGAMLASCCMILKYKYPEAQDIIGIATEPHRENEDNSEDLMYLDARNWNEELNKKAEELQHDLKILISPKKTAYSTSEYPPLVLKKVGRNERCPCGSGKKYKHCHGR